MRGSGVIGFILFFFLVLVLPFKSSASVKPDCTQAQISNFQNQINSAAERETVYAEGCIYRSLFTIPWNKNNLTIDGKGQAEIRGADLWGDADWEEEDIDGKKYWKSKKTFDLINFAKYRRSGYGGNRTFCQFGKDIDSYQCLWPEQVFFDDKPLKHVGEGAVVGSGEFKVELTEGSESTWAPPERTGDDPNRRKGKVILAGDPRGHSVEVTTREYWLRVDGSGAPSSDSAPGNINITGFTMKYAANTPQSGALETFWRSASGYGQPAGFGRNWTIKNNVFWFAQAGAIAPTGGSMKVMDNDFGFNGLEAITSGSSGIEIRGNRIHHNNFKDFLSGWHGGGFKLVGVDGAIVDNNEVYDNNGPGIWCDIGCKNVEISNNNVHGNAWGGIDYEVSSGANIHDNVVWDNGWRNWDVWDPVGGGVGAGILIRNSSNNQINNNILAWNNSGITVMSLEAGADPVNCVGSKKDGRVTYHPDDPSKIIYCPALNKVTGNTISNNKILMNETSGDKKRYALGWLQQRPETIKVKDGDRVLATHNYKGVLYEAASNNRGSNNQFWYQGGAGGENSLDSSISPRFAWGNTAEATTMSYRSLSNFKNLPGGQGSCYIGEAGCSQDAAAIINAANSKLIAAREPRIPRYSQNFNVFSEEASSTSAWATEPKIVQSLFSPVIRGQPSKQIAWTRFCNIGRDTGTAIDCRIWDMKTVVQEDKGWFFGTGIVTGFGSYSYIDSNQKQKLVQTLIFNNGAKAMTNSMKVTLNTSVVDIVNLTRQENLNVGAVAAYGSYAYKQSNGKWKGVFTIITDGNQYRQCSFELDDNKIDPFENCSWSDPLPLNGYFTGLTPGREVKFYNTHSFIDSANHWQVLEIYGDRVDNRIMQRKCPLTQEGLINVNGCSQPTDITDDFFAVQIRDVDDNNRLYPLSSSSKVPMSWSGSLVWVSKSSIPGVEAASFVAPPPSQSQSDSQSRSKSFDSRTFMRFGNDWIESITIDNKAWNFKDDNLWGDKNPATLSGIPKYRDDGPCKGLGENCKFDTRTFITMNNKYLESITVGDQYWNFNGNTLENKGNLHEVGKYNKNNSGPCAELKENCKFDTRTFIAMGNDYWESITAGNKYWNFDRAGNNIRDKAGNIVDSGVLLSSVSKYISKYGDSNGPCYNKNPCKFDTRTFTPMGEDYWESITIGDDYWNFSHKTGEFKGSGKLSYVKKYKDNSLLPTPTPLSLTVSSDQSQSSGSYLESITAGNNYWNFNGDIFKSRSRRNEW